MVCRKIARWTRGRTRSGRNGTERWEYHYTALTPERVVFATVACTFLDLAPACSDIVGAAAAAAAEAAAAAAAPTAVAAVSGRTVAGRLLIACCILAAAVAAAAVAVVAAAAEVAAVAARTHSSVACWTQQQVQSLRSRDGWVLCKVNERIWEGETGAARCKRGAREE